MDTTRPALDVLAGSAPSASAAPAVEFDRDRAEVRRLAQEFEAMLLTQMMREMRQSLVDDDAEQSEFGALRSAADTEVGRALSAAGGFGLLPSLELALRRLSEAASGGRVMTSSVTAPQTSSTVEGAGPVAPATPLDETGGRGPDAAPITSGFGWRRDPFTGAAAFHGGVDLRMAYGLDVTAVADGRVRFAGEQGGYGTMVAVEHEDGRETRYAHLAESVVRPGDVVHAGQVLGRSGSSGRATGPHLHFEVLVEGRRVNPLDEWPGERMTTE